MERGYGSAEEDSMVKVLFIAACLGLCFGGICAAEPGTLMWTELYMADYSGLAQAISCRGNMIYSAGQIWPDKDIGRNRSVITARNGKTGELIWSDGGDEGSVAMTVTSGPGRVYGAGTKTVSAAQTPLFVKAYNLAGKPAWELVWPDSGSAIANDIALNISLGRVFVAGSTIPSDQSQGFFTVLSLNSANGNLVWEQSGRASIDGEGRKGDARAVAGDSGRVFAVGAFRDDVNMRDGFAVRAYGMSTGKLLWEDVQWPEGKGAEGAYLLSYATAVAATSSRVYVAGSTYGEDGGGSFTIRAYNAGTGKLVWEDRYNHYSYFHDAAQSVFLQGGRLFVGGFVTLASAGRAYAVRAYDASKGTLLWSSLTGGYDIEENGVSALVAAGNVVYAAGTARNGTAFTVRAYNRATGALLWEGFIPQGEATDGFGDAFAICSASAGIFAGGTSKTDAGYGFTVAGYSTR